MDLFSILLDSMSSAHFCLDLLFTVKRNALERTVHALLQPIVPASRMACAFQGMVFGEIKYSIILPMKRLQSGLLFLPLKSSLIVVIDLAA